MDQTAAVELFAMLNLAAPLPLHRLPASECDRALALRDVSARHRFVSGRLMVRTLLAERTGLRAGALDIVAPHGRAPRLNGSDWRFSLSHSAECCVLALSRVTPVGIDIERLRPVDDALQLAQRFFHPQERAWLSSHDAAQRSQAFLQLWVRKEAVVKANGRGLAMTLDDWSVLPAAPLATAFDVCDGAQQRWRVHDLVAGADHACALVTLPGVDHEALRWIDAAQLA